MLSLCSEPFGLKNVFGGVGEKLVNIEEKIQSS